MAFWAMAAGLSQADPHRDRLGYAVGVLLTGACEQLCDHRAPSQGPIDYPAAPPLPGRPGHFPGGTAPGAGPRIILRLPRDPHAMIVAARWCPGQAPPSIRRPYSSCPCRGLARQSGLACGLVSITMTRGEPADAEPSAPPDAAPVLPQAPR